MSITVGNSSDPEPTMYVIVLIKKKVDFMKAHAFVIYFSGVLGF